ncbi:MAG: septum formation initiator family protein [Bacteroidales bacterium]|nr:septum formation initiator family protein [Bacteroidales bacterium]
MGKIKDIWNGEDRSFVRFAVIVTAAFLILAGFILPNSLWRWAKSGAELRRQNQQIEALKADIARMDEQIRKLSDDRDSLERFARENYGFAAPDEDVYVLK